MQIMPVRYDNIVDNHHLLDGDNEAHPELLHCLADFFAKAEAICLDFTSVSITTRRDFDHLIAVASLYAQQHDTPFIMMPLKTVKNVLGKGTVAFEGIVPLMVVDDDVTWHWYGPAAQHASALDYLFSTGQTLSKSEATERFGQPSADFLQDESSRHGSHIAFDDQGFKCRITLSDLQAFLSDDCSQKLTKGLDDSCSLLKYGHFVIDDSGTHTDTIILVERLLDKSTRSVEKLLVMLRDAVANLTYDGIVCGPRLQSIAPTIGATLDRHVVTADPWRKLTVPTGVPIPPKNSRVLVIDSLIRTGGSLSSIAQMARDMDYVVAGAVAFFGSKPTVWVDDLKCTCRSLVHLPLNEWSVDTCPLCALGIESTVVTRETVEHLLQTAAPLSHATSHHFWNYASMSGCVEGNGVKHFHDASGHHFTFYIDVARLLAKPEVRRDIARHLYTRLLQELETQGLGPQGIRHIVYKNTPSSQLLAEEMAVVLDGWVNLHPVDSADVLAMQLDPEKWPPSIYDLAQVLNREATILVDDGINRGWTISTFVRFFELMDISHIATAVVTNRSESLSVTAEYYRPSLPAWHHADCPVCSQAIQLGEFCQNGAPSDVAAVMKTSQAELKAIPLEQL